MSYEKHTWETGETITAEKMNNLEDGVASKDQSGEKTTILSINWQGSNTTIEAGKIAQLNFMPANSIEKSRIKGLWFENNSTNPLIPIVTNMNGSAGMFSQMSVNVYNPTSSNITLQEGAGLVMKVSILTA